MGLYDREYYGGRQQPPGLTLGSLRLPQTIVGWLILINVAIYLVSYFISPNYYAVTIENKQGKPICSSGFIATSVSVNDPQAIAATRECHEELKRLISENKASLDNIKAPILSNQGKALSYLMAAKYDTLAKPYNIYQTLTYAFAHSMHEFTHILFNMLVLFFFGRDVERVLGRGEFLRFYLVAAIFGGLVWCLIALLSGNMVGQVVGASGAIAAVVILYCFKFPNRMVLLFFVIPMPAWVLGVIFVALDLLGALGHSTMGSNVAYPVHLAGAAFGVIYANSNIRLTQWLRLPGFLNFSGSRRPKVRLHDPDRDSYGQGGSMYQGDSYGSDNYDSTEPAPSRQERREAKRQAQEAERRRQLEEDVERILDKIHRHGQGSLTKKEQATLEQRSRELREMKKKDDQ